MVLKACSSICREWRTISQRYLFQYLNIDDEARANGILGLIENSPHLVTHIRVLSVCTGETGDFWATSSLVLPELVPRLQHVTHLSLMTDMSMSRRNVQTVGSLFAQLRSLDSLSIVEHGFNGPTEKDLLATLLGYFPRLRSLSLRSPACRKVDDLEATLETHTPFFALSELHLSDFPDCWTLEWLLRIPWSNLTRLTISYVSRVAISSINRLLSAAGANLRELHLVESLEYHASGESTVALALHMWRS